MVQPTSRAGVPELTVPARRLDGTGNPTVWSEFGALAAELPDAVNLGQGFPDWVPPEFVVEAAQAALRDGFHQYTRPAGHPALAQVLARRYSRHLHRDVAPMEEVAVTVGASQALYLTLQALLNPGEEVLLLEPAFDLYYGQIRLAGGVAVPVPLSVDGAVWSLDIAALEASVTERTKLLVLNSPHNPTGKTFSADEMEAIAALVRRHPNLRVISDEVYKYTVYAGEPHTHFAALPGMFDRTVTLSSAGKTFSITGWQAGWCVGPAELIKPIQLLLPFVQFCVSTPMQEALARVLDLAGAPCNRHATAMQPPCNRHATAMQPPCDERVLDLAGAPPPRQRRVNAVCPPCARRVPAVCPPCDCRVPVLRPSCDRRVPAASPPRRRRAASCDRRATALT